LSELTTGLSDELLDELTCPLSLTLMNHSALLVSKFPCRSLPLLECERWQSARR